jgi:hypothetical protein
VPHQQCAGKIMAYRFSYDQWKFHDMSHLVLILLLYGLNEKLFMAQE